MTHTSLSTPPSPSPVRDRRWAVLAVCCLAQLLIALDLTVLHLAVPALAETLNPSATQLLWVADVYGFALAGFLITMGSIGDRIGRRKLLLLGSAGFGLASLLTAYAPNPELLIAARALLGVAAATLMPSTLSIIRNVFTEQKQRAAAVGMWSGVAVLGIGLGPVIAGFLLAHFWWGSVFLVNVPVVLGILVAGALVLPESRNPRPGRLDVPSVVLSVTGLIAVVYTIKEIAYQGFAHLDVAVAAVLGVVALVLFVRRQRRLAEPLIEVALFAKRAFSATVGTAMIAMFAQLAVSLLMAQYLQLVLGWSPLKSGLAGLPGMAGAMAGGTLAGLLAAKLGRAVTVALGCGLSVAGFALLAQLEVGTPYPYLVLTYVVFSAGVALSLTVATDTVLGVVPKERAGSASAISETAGELGAALGIAVLGSLAAAVYRSRLELPAGLPAELTGPVRESLGGAVAGAARLPGELGAAVLDQARHAYVGGMQVTMYCCMGIMLALGISALFTLRGVPKVLEDAPE